MVGKADEGIREFFGGDTMLAFVNQHQAGPAPWGSALMADGSLVLSESDRSSFYVLHADGEGGYGAVYVDDALTLLDTDFSPLEAGMGSVTLVEGETTAEAAFLALCEKLELDLDLGSPTP